MLKGNMKYILPIILVIVFAIVGATFAYWFWQSGVENRTNVTLRVTSNFSCGINGGGDIVSANVAPASCTNSTYAIQRTVTTTISNSGTATVSLDMWLKVNSIASELANSSNFKWALTKDSTSCTNNVVNTGTFQGTEANSEINLFTGVTSADTYYLYIWLDSAETSSITMNKSFNVSLEGICYN